MTSRLIRLTSVLTSILLFGAAQASATPENATTTLPLAVRANNFIKAKDYLGFRIFIKKSYGNKLTYGDWYSLKNLVNIQAVNTGFDLVQLWSLRNSSGKSQFDTNLEKADQLMLTEHFEEAFTQYQLNLSYLRKLREYSASLNTNEGRERREDIDSLYPFVLHSMGRALYGAGRFKEALTVFSWIKPSYPRFRQVLFEKMWAGFRSGQVEIALGAIASQRSAYFSKYLSPESYLIQTYVYRKLCRSQEVEQVVAEMKSYEAALNRGEIQDWAMSDTEGLVLLKLSSAPDPKSSEEIAPAEREIERTTIKRALKQAFEKQKPRLLQDLKSTIAYAHLAAVADTATALKPVKEFKSREELLAQDLEFWPADSAEEWIDEVGTHVFMGESLCTSKTQ